MTSSKDTESNGDKTALTENLHPCVTYDEKLMPINFRCVLRVLLYMLGVKNSFVGDWIEVVIVTIMGQYIFLILYFRTRLLLLLLFLFLIFFLFLFIYFDFLFICLFIYFLIGSIGPAYRWYNFSQEVILCNSNSLPQVTR